MRVSVKVSLILSLRCCFFSFFHLLLIFYRAISIQGLFLFHKHRVNKAFYQQLDAERYSYCYCPSQAT